MIYFHSEDSHFLLNNEQETITWLHKVISAEGKELDEINYVFCSDSYLLKINQDYLEHDYYTDIITFPYSYQPIKSDIYISIDRVTENASTESVSFRQELYRVIVHGLLHMCGYEDGDDDSKKTMRQKEDQYIAIIAPTSPA